MCCDSGSQQQEHHGQETASKELRRHGKENKADELNTMTLTPIQRGRCNKELQPDELKRSQPGYTDGRTHATIATNSLIIRMINWSPWWPR
ncbi:UNVERIFIED_CONTAM: hypothetical protein FKN15_013295 [Acipenser sinensis]